MTQTYYKHDITHVMKISDTALIFMTVVIKSHSVFVRSATQSLHVKNQMKLNENELSVIYVHDTCHNHDKGDMIRVM